MKRAFQINDDGAGFMFNHPVNDEVVVIKGWFGFRKYYKTFRKFEEQFPSSTFVLHMRIGTSGLKDVLNCHPFKIKPNCGFAHNGCMSSLGDKVRSDTREFSEEVLYKLPDNFWDQPDIIKRIDDCAKACNSKYVFLFGDGSCLICNENMGTWTNDVWYSNQSHVPLTTVYCTDNRTDFLASSLCVRCHTKLDFQEIGYKRGPLTLCKSCLSDSLDILQIQCESCHASRVLTEGLLASEECICEYCGESITKDDIAWQLIAMHGVV